MNGPKQTLAKGEEMERDRNNLLSQINDILAAQIRGQQVQCDLYLCSELAAANALNGWDE